MVGLDPRIGRSVMGERERLSASGSSCSEPRHCEECTTNPGETEPDLFMICFLQELRHNMLIIAVRWLSLYGCLEIHH